MHLIYSVSVTFINIGILPGLQHWNGTESQTDHDLVPAAGSVEMFVKHGHDVDRGDVVDAATMNDLRR